MKLSPEAERARFMALVFNLEEACQDFGMAPTAERCERVRLARRVLVAAYDQVCLRLTIQSPAA